MSLTSSSSSVEVLQLHERFRRLLCLKHDENGGGVREWKGQGNGEQGEERGSMATVVIYLGLAELHGEPQLPSFEQRLLAHREGREGS